MDTINKAFKILEVFLTSEDELSIGELSSSTKISASTSHRIASILVKRGYLDQSHKRGKYSLSTKKLVEFARIIRKRLKVRNVALPYMKELSRAVDEAVELSLRHGQTAYTVEVANSDRLLNIAPDSTTLTLHSTGVGKILLAQDSEKELDEYLSEVLLNPRTANTIIDADELKRHLKKVRQDGVAFDDEEYEPGIRSVAAPIKDRFENVVAAIGVVGPANRISGQRMVELAPLVKQYAARISQTMRNVNGHL